MNRSADDVLAAVQELATTGTLLVACDFDGTLAPFVDDPMTARPLPTAVTAFNMLASLPRTHAVLLSGRSLGDLEWLARHSEIPESVDLIGSHGWEDPATIATIGESERERHAELVVAAEGVRAVAEGVIVEHKPASVTVHFRAVAPERRAAVVAAIDAGPGQVPGVYVLHGKEVVEFTVVHVDKGVALERCRQRMAATGTFFIGDDVTDERAFAVLGDGDVGVKVGGGETLARLRVDDPQSATELVMALAAARAAHVRE